MPGRAPKSSRSTILDLCPPQPTPAKRRGAPAYAVTGKICGLDGDGTVYVQLPDREGEPHPAMCTMPVDGADLGREAIVVFLDGDPSRPAIVGLARAQQRRRWASLRLNGDRVTLDAEQELVLRCGRARLTLRADGKIELRGVRVTSRASQTNAIKGGTIRLN